MDANFEVLFKTAMEQDLVPYPYQTKLAIEPWPDIVKIPTGMGKTAGIILSWLYKRLQNDSDTPRRLVYCLPMRVLVEQTAKNARNWVEKLVDSNIIQQNSCPSIHVLMGGEIEVDWDRFPENDAILIGTQDQLLSRALNRGYAMSRFRWPIQFGLLNNDCMWVMDEVQLMGAGLATTTQLQAFRNALGTAFPVRSLWMSATFERDWLSTIDFSQTIDELQELELSNDDMKNSSVKGRIHAKKTLNKADHPADKPDKIAKTILDLHQKGTRTLVVVNTVSRAVEIYDAVKQKQPEADLTLVHSRFRPQDRQKALEKLLAPPDKAGSICISTQVVEAGVDVSATTLITDLAPWSSLVQRFGRCNRYGLDNDANVFWLDIDLKKKGTALPYTEEELQLAASILQNLTDAGPGSLPHVSSEVSQDHVIRRKDIIDLFDTTPDLSGMDIDISRFIRETDDHDVYVFWRDIAKEGPKNEETSPSRDELCSVPINDLRKVSDLERWRWDHLEKRWDRLLPLSIAPGMILMLNRSSGCYNSEVGWTGKKKDIPETVELGQLIEEANDDDRYVPIGWQTLAEHTDEVVGEMKYILSNYEFPDKHWEEVLLTAARWHDSGKAHGVFQSAMGDEPPSDDDNIVWAKSGIGTITYERKGFRHELASALAMLENQLPDLAVYLAVAHHGKVRLSIRSLPHEKAPKEPDLRFARGIWDGDLLPEVELGGRYVLPETALDLSYMEFGEGPKGPSWLARMLALRDDPNLGPFRLAFLEAMLRAADSRASEKAGEQNE